MQAFIPINFSRLLQSPNAAIPIAICIMFIIINVQSSLRVDQFSADRYKFMVCVSLIPSHLSHLPLDPGDLFTDLTLSITLHHCYS